MAMKTVPAPTKGRVVFYRDEAEAPVWAAVVADVDPDDPRRVRLGVFDFDEARATAGRTFPAPTKDYVLYGEDKPGCWWWPPRSDATMEVEDGA